MRAAARVVCASGAPAGAARESRREKLYYSDLATTYRTRLSHFISIPGVHTHGAILIITLNLRPSTTFNHHFRLAPPTITTEPPPPPSTTLALATDANTAALRAIAVTLRIDPDQLRNPFSPNLTAFQALLPATAGGISLPNAVVLAMHDRLPLVLH